MTFHVGQKVVCVDVGIAPGLEHVSGQASEFLELHRIYVIRWIGECPHEPWRAYGDCVRLEGIERGPGGHNPDWYDFPFRAARFRPVVERKTEISIFTRMLTSQRVPA